MKKSPLAVLGIIMILIVVMTSLVIGCSKEEAPATSSEPATTTTTTEPTTTTTTEPEEEEVYELTFSTQWPEAGPNWQQGFKLVVEDIEKNSNGRIKITSFPGGALGKNDEQYDIARTGKADMIHVSTGYTPGRFPLSELMTLPLAYDSSYECQEMVNAVGHRILYLDYPDTHITEYNQSQIFYLYSNKPVTTLEDMKGLKTRTSGAMMTNVVEALGGAPVSMGLGDLYLSLQTGVVDASITGPSGLISFNLQEVVKHEVRINLGCTAQMWAVNLDTWNSLPEDLQQVITEATEKVGINEVNLFNQDTGIITDYLVEHGGTSIELDDVEYQRWVATITPIVDEYLDELRAKDLPADELMDIIKEECSKRNIDFPF